MKAQKTTDSQNNLKKEEQSWRYHAPWFQTILHKYDTDAKPGHMDQINRIQSLKRTHTYMDNWSMTKGQGCTVEKTASLSSTALGKLDSHTQENQTRLYALYTKIN